MRFKISQIPAAAALMILSSAAVVNAATSPAMADTTIVQSSPAESRTGWSFLTAGPGTQGVVSFALSAVLPPGATAAGIMSAKLMLDVPTVSAPGSLQVTLLQRGFSEATAPTWTNRPPAATGADTTAILPVNEPLKLYFVEVTAMVKRALSLGMSEFTVAISPAANTPTASALIWSRESALVVPAWTPMLAPRLFIDLAQPAASPAFFWVTGGTQLSCLAYCPAGSVAAPNAAGKVCRDTGGGESTFVQFAKPGPLAPEQWQCGSYALAQCHCMKQ